MLRLTLTKPTIFVLLRWWSAKALASLESLCTGTNHAACGFGMIFLHFLQVRASWLSKNF